jgi:hypothetical protein
MALLKQEEVRLQSLQLKNGLGQSFAFKNDLVNLLLFWSILSPWQVYISATSILVPIFQHPRSPLFEENKITCQMANFSHFSHKNGFSQKAAQGKGK